jgi:hypothetical protein
VIWQALLGTVQSQRFALLPKRIRGHQWIQFQRLAQRADMRGAWLSLDEDVFHKELGIATLRLYAGAAQLIDPGCGLPRSLPFRSGWQGLRDGFFMALDCGGFQPMFQVHTHTEYLDEFNEEGWNECYRCCADLYTVHPKSRGMFGGSWFYDPQLATISPRLAYLCSVPRAGGAHFLLTAKDGAFVSDAISTSPSRRKLYEAGTYRPCSYSLIWSRKAQMRWAQNHPGGMVEPAA